MTQSLEQLQKEYGARVGVCPICGQPRVIKVSHTVKNPERAFASCANREHKSFVWLDQLGQQLPLRPVTLPSEFMEKTRKETEARRAALGEETGVVKTLVNGEWIADSSPDPLSFLKPAEGDALSFLKVESTPSVATPFIPSKYHPPIFHAFETRERNVVIESCPGSGKTTSIEKAMAYTRPNNKVIAVAFGKDIAEVLKTVMPSHAEASTTHALALENVRVRYPDGKLDPKGRKTWDTMSELDPHNTFEEHAPQVNRMVSLLQQTLREPTTDNMDWLAEHYGIEVNGDRAKVFAFAKETFEKVVSDKATYDFDNIIYWCATDPDLCRKFDDLLVDEGQDQCPAQIRMLLNSLARDGRIYAFADRNQSVMGFRGADIEAVDNIVKATHAIQLPLSISYRCPINVVKKAQTLVPQMEWKEGAKEGIVDELASLPYRPREGSFILCRVNAPLVPICMDLIRRGVHARIRGREVADGLVSMVLRMEKKTKSKDLRVIFQEMERTVSQECARLEQTRRETQALNLRDRMETLLVLGENLYSVGQLIQKIKEIFSTEKAPVTLTTCHGAKGLQAPDVYIVKPSLMPFKKATQAWERVQEKNLQFVAWTRAQEGLYFIRE